MEHENSIIYLQRVDNGASNYSNLEARKTSLVCQKEQGEEKEKSLLFIHTFRLLTTDVRLTPKISIMNIEYAYLIR